MKGASSVVGMVDSIASDVACVHISSDVEVNRIPGTNIEETFFLEKSPSDPERLSHTGKLSVADPCLHKSLIFVLGTESAMFEFITWQLFFTL